MSSLEAQSIFRNKSNARSKIIDALYMAFAIAHGFCHFRKNGTLTGSRLRTALKTPLKQALPLPMNYDTFIRRHPVSLEAICREIYHDQHYDLKIKKEERAVKNLALIMAAVLRLSQKKGFYSMSLRELSQESGLSMGGLYAYFASKEDLLKIIFTAGQSLIMKHLKSELHLFVNVQDRFAAAICTHLYLSEALHRLFYFFYTEAKTLSAENRSKAIAMEQLTESIFSDIITEGSEARKFETNDPLMSASLLKALLQDWYLKRYKYLRRKISVEDYAQFILQMMWASLNITGDENEN